MNHILDAFSDTRKWAKICAITFFVVFALQLSNFFTSSLPEAIGSILASVLYYLLPGLYLWRYANHIADAENTNDPLADLEAACQQQGRFFRFIGILYVIVSVVAFIGVIFAIALPAYMNYVSRATGS